MARWVDVRVTADQAHYAVRALTEFAAPSGLTFSWDPNPPSAAPGMEHQLSIQGMPEQRVLAVLDLAGVSVLASRTRLANALEPPVEAAG